MLALVFCLLVQPSNDLFTKLDALYEKQVAQLKSDIEASKRDARKSAKFKQELTSLTKSYALTLPIFEFNKGVSEGDVGTIGYYMSEQSKRVDRGDGVMQDIGYQEKMIRQGKVTKIDGDLIHIQLWPANEGGSVVVAGMPSKNISEEKVIMLNKFIYEYAGKYKDSNAKFYRIIGNDSDYKAWQKYRSSKK